MVLKLYGFPQSPNVTRIAVILLEKKVPFEFVLVDTAQREHKSPEYLDKQPFGQVPYIDDDGFILYESWAIARYVCEKYRDQGPDLLPTDLKKRARIDQAASVEQANFAPSSRIIVWEGLVKGIFGQQTDQAKLDEAKATFEEKLDGYERILSKQKYLAGDEVTLVDLIHLGYGAILPRAGCSALADAEKRPNVARWFKEIQSRPSWQTLLKDGVKSTA
ncbi:Glutathione S-transferase F11 [Leucoagaricus sp. SymC.cos]|nr:Glutathione S-transferase F11 [Leucoagaricus sp. SymC.cos]